MSLESIGSIFTKLPREDQINEIKEMFQSIPYDEDAREALATIVSSDIDLAAESLCGLPPGKIREFFTAMVPYHYTTQWEHCDDFVKEVFLNASDDAKESITDDILEILDDSRIKEEFENRGLYPDLDPEEEIPELLKQFKDKHQNSTIKDFLWKLWKEF